MDVYISILRPFLDKNSIFMQRDNKFYADIVRERERERDSRSQPAKRKKIKNNNGRLQFMGASASAMWNVSR